MLYVEPGAGVGPVLQMINSARPGGELLLNYYYLDDKTIVSDISDAVIRGVGVFIIVEGNPYGFTPAQVSGEIAALQDTGAKVETTPQRFQSRGGHPAFDHAKYAVSRQEVLVETGNLDRSAFSRDRDYLYTSDDPNLIKAMETLFVADWSGQDADDAVRGMVSNLVLSPGADDQIVEQIAQPGQVCVEVEELGSDVDVIEALQNKGGEASVVIPEQGGRTEEQTIGLLEASGVKVRELSKNPVYLHAKLIAGSQSAYIGSQNFSRTSLDFNREVGIVLNDAGDLQTLQSQCRADFSSAHVIGASD